MSQTYIGIPQQEYDFWRESGSTNGTLPNGTNDTIKQIQRRGNIVLGGPDFTTAAITGVVNPVDANVYFSLSNTVEKGQILWGNTPLSYYFQRSLEAAAGSYTDMMQLALTGGAHNIRLNAHAVNGGTLSTSKAYIITSNNNQTSKNPKG